MTFLNVKTLAGAALLAVASTTGAWAQAVCPTNALSLSGTTTCSCPAEYSNSAVWGSGPYTADSNICTAARHSGAVAQGGGAITVTMTAGQANYSGSSAYGVNTSNWGSYGSSYVVARAYAGGGGGQACGRMPSGQDVYVCSCAPGGSSGSVWGTGPYTDDSNICQAAIHAGVISAGGGNVRVLRAPGLDAYRGSAWNGITTSDYGNWGRSITFDRN